MSKLTSKADFMAKYEACKGLLALRVAGGSLDSKKKDILCCGGTGCHASCAQEIMDNLTAAIKEAGLENDVRVIQTGCFGFCAQGPIVKVMPDNIFYVQVTPEDAKEIVEKHIVNHEPVERLLFVEPMLKESIRDYAKMSFYAKQSRISLRNCGLIDAESIDEYIANEGYMGLAKCLFDMTPDKVVQEVLNSGICGRGGAGFPTGMKWKIAASVKAEEKYIVCNADEGDPGAFMDRSIMEGDPNSVIEAMAIGAYAIGAQRGLVYIRAEYPLAVSRLQLAIDHAREAGLLGNNILGTDFSFDIEIKLGAGAFVCGEETALIHSMEGQRGEPTTKPPFPANIGGGYWGCSTNVNNVETYASIPQIIVKGADWYAGIGNWKRELDENGNFVKTISGNSGTKVFALAGQINNVGLVEVPMGTTLREIIYDIGGGISDNCQFKAVQTGGPSGGCITEENLDTPIDFMNLQKIGSMMGSGGMIVLSNKDCMPAMAKFYLEFTKDESCGKCTPCRIGTRRMLEMLEKICDGNGTEEMLEELEELANTIKDTALCGLGQTAPNPILSTLRYFRDEYIAHVRDKKCPAGTCTKLYTLTITDACKGCTKCARFCPVDAIVGKVKEKHVIDPAKCIKCGACISSCPFKAIIKE
ncbi:MAG: NADH-quinone oxidoreductase subunit NuoF [Kiritimatiellae bacterium]|jgi:NADH:ubiquinone oxidoreductase subunit F (NADH-binding)/(2Fe-2S) ferredoxin/NAD-dependent dihydropyrimidine dehydrogenase PreA subunit|nr:NADH-quinone oxidoreductase subunit NuoF [Kiritimatiellia bacterium]